MKVFGKQIECPERMMKMIHVLSVAGRAFVQARCGLHAAGLTYFSLLGCVPVLCLIMVCAKTCGLGDVARTKINEQVTTLVAHVKLQGEATKDLTNQIQTAANALFDRINAFDVSTLGWIGFLMLMWTVISTFGQIETSMNEIWHVAKPRPLWARCCLYLFIALILPLLVTLALSMPLLRTVEAILSATLGATAWTKALHTCLVGLLHSSAFSFGITLLFSTCTFTFLLKVIPHHAMRFSSALVSGLVTALLFGFWVRLCTLAGIGIAQSSALYGSFAALPILLAWLFTSWQIVLLGSCLTYALETYSSHVPVCTRK